MIDDELNGHGFGDAKCGLNPRELARTGTVETGFPPLPEGTTMRKDPTHAELIEHEVETESHRLVSEWQTANSEFFKRDVAEIVEGFAEWLLKRRAPPGNALCDLADRLTPNPAMTAAGTLAVILDAIDKIDDQWLARSLAYVNMRNVQGMEVAPLTDEQWKDGDLQAKLRLLQTARDLKAALREASKP